MRMSHFAPAMDAHSMTTDTMELTNFHLGRKQKSALRARAQAKGSNMAEEIRRAVDTYLSGVTAEDLEVLDMATRRAQADIAEMAEQLDATNRKAGFIFAELAQLRAGQPPEPANEARLPAQHKAQHQAQRGGH